MRISSYGYGAPIRCDRSSFCLYSVSGRMGRSDGGRTRTVTARSATFSMSSTAPRLSPVAASGVRIRTDTFSRPSPAASGASLCASLRQVPVGMSQTGRT